MTSRELSRFVLSVFVAAAMLAGCGGSQPPIGAPGAMPQTSAIATHAERGKSWMVPGASSGALLYAPVGCGGTCVISYPGLKLVGSLSTPGDGVCSDSQGNIFSLRRNGDRIRAWRFATDSNPQSSRRRGSGLRSRSQEQQPRSGL